MGEGHLLGAAAVLYVAAGIIAINDPFAAATILTLFLGIALIAGGIVRMFLAWSMRAPASRGLGRGVGILSLLLGLIIIAKWPYSSAYVLGISWASI